MPTMTDPGESKELSIQEVLELMRKNDGQGGLQQITVGPDGQKTVTDIYGNVSGLDDGMDRSVNVFFSVNTLNFFIKKYLQDQEDESDTEEGESEEKSPYRGYVMTVDDLDKPCTWVLTVTEDAAKLVQYVRDERKSNRVVISDNSWRSDSYISYEDVEKEKQLIFLIAFIQLRKYLKKEGYLEQLQRLNNRSAGILIEGNKEEISARIVRGKNRPELPCHSLLLGDYKCRPYADEMLTTALLASMSEKEKTKAAEDGDPDAMEALAQAYVNGDEQIAQDFEKSFYWWQKYAETGNAVGAFNVGLYYAKGCGVKRDFRKAAEWMKISAERGDEDAPNAAALYLSAADNLTKAEQGDAAAQAEISKTFMQMGGSLEQFGNQSDYAEAFRWAGASADQGNLDGLYYLGLCYEHGRGTTVDHEKAVQKYKTAAMKGHAPSQWNLAVAYMTGKGAQLDTVKAYEWAYRAAEQGNELAVQGLNQQGRSINDVISRYADPQQTIMLEETQYEDRAERCEKIHAGDELTCSLTKNRGGRDALECFCQGGSVGLISDWSAAEVIALLKLGLISAKAIVRRCIPKSMRSARARNAQVNVALELTRRTTENPADSATIKHEQEAAMTGDLEMTSNNQIQEENMKEKDKSSRFTLTYEQGVRFKGEGYSIAIPDGFGYKENTDGRDFVAWFPAGDGDDYSDAELTLMAGQFSAQNGTDPNLMTPALSYAMVESMFWQNPIMRNMYQEDSFIPFINGNVGGGIIAGYDEESANYQIMFYRKGGMQGLRVMSLNTAAEDRDACDQAVLGWLGTIQMNEMVGSPKTLDDDSFAESKLNDELIAEWKKTSDTRFSTFSNYLNVREQTIRTKVKAGEIDAEEASQETRVLLKDVAGQMAAFLEMGCRGIQKIKDNHPDDSNIERICNVLRPAVFDSDRVTASADGGRSEMGERIGNIEKIRQWFLQLDTREETAAMAEAAAEQKHFTAPLYENKRTVIVDELTVSVPDNMLTLDDAVPGENVSEDFLPKLQSTYALVAVPDDFPEGFDSYGDGAFCLNMSKTMNIDMLSQFYNGKASDRIRVAKPATMTDCLERIMKKQNAYRPKYPVEYVGGNERLGIVMMQTSDPEDTGNDRTAYMFMLFFDDRFGQGNVYINVPGDKEEIKKAATEWMLKFRLTSQTGEEGILHAASDAADRAPAMNIPGAEPADGQHTHLDFLQNTKKNLSFLGGLIQVNQNGTEYAFQAIDDLIASTDSPLRELYVKISNTAAGRFELAEKAHAMSRVFRMSPEFFNAGHDREQEIENGLIQRAAVYDAFRSFAWTVNAFCKQNGIKPVQLTYEQLEEIADYIEKKDGLNYTADTHSPVLCSGDDIHVYYLPDAVSQEDRHNLLSLVNGSQDAVGVCSTASLEGLRTELEYLYPAMQTIHRHLAAERDDKKPLEGGTADALYSWCSMTYAARRAIYSEDGPMNCWWEHPDAQRIREINWKIDSIKREKDMAKEWLDKNRKYLAYNERIMFPGKSFVFAGVENTFVRTMNADSGDEWLELLQVLTRKGGLHKTGVSGKTDYLVCNPAYAGDSKVRQAREQQMKGKPVKIILLSDFMKALGMPLPTPEERIAELERSLKPEEEKTKGKDAESTIESDTAVSDNTAEIQQKEEDEQQRKLSDQELSQYSSQLQILEKNAYILRHAVEKTKTAMRKHVVPPKKKLEKPVLKQVEDKDIQIAPPQINKRTDKFINSLMGIIFGSGIFGVILLFSGAVEIGLFFIVAAFLVWGLSPVFGKIRSASDNRIEAAHKEEVAHERERLEKINQTEYESAMIKYQEEKEKQDQLDIRRNNFQTVQDIRETLTNLLQNTEQILRKLRDEQSVPEEIRQSVSIADWPDKENELNAIKESQADMYEQLSETWEKINVINNSVVSCLEADKPVKKAEDAVQQMNQVQNACENARQFLKNTFGVEDKPIKVQQTGHREKKEASSDGEKDERELIKAEILEYMADGEMHTVTDIMGGVWMLNSKSNMYAASLIREMREAGILERTEINRKAYFKIR